MAITHDTAKRPSEPPAASDAHQQDLYTDCVLVSAGATETEKGAERDAAKDAAHVPAEQAAQGPAKEAAQEAAEQASSPQTAAGASAPLSTPALETAPKGEDGPLISEADPTSNAG